MTDNGFQNLSRTLMSGKPVKILVLDNQTHSAVCAGAIASLTDPAGDFPPAGSGWQAEGETRKELAVLAMAHRAAYVLQSTVAHPAHLVEGFIDGLVSRRPAVFNLYAVCPPKHGVRQSSALERSRLAVEARAFPLFQFDPDRGTVFSECVSLAGNPEAERDWPTYTLQYQDAQGNAGAMTLPLTYADFAAGEGRFGRHFQRVAPEAWSDDMVLLADWLKLDAEARAASRPFIWGVDAERRLARLLVSGPLAALCDDRLRYWRQLRSIAGMAVGEESPAEIADRVRQELMQRLSESLGLNLPTMPVTVGMAAAPVAAATATAPVDATAAAAPAVAEGGSDAVTVDSEECTGCDECITLAPKTFVYNAEKQATVADPRGSRYADLVKAAEKCTGSCIHPGMPWDMSEPGVEKLVARAAKFN